MSIRLKNEYLCLDIQKPGCPYRGSRFDWTGQIVQITFLDKYTFCTTETLNEQMFDKQGRGLYNEFGIDQPVGYNDCPVGWKFPKIGVGLLTKGTNKPYDFFYDYPVTPYSFPYAVENTKAQFFCETEKSREFAFQLDKRIELDKKTFTIHYSLSNCGKKVIKTNEYVHNFLSINRRPIDANYKLSIPFEIRREKLEQIVNPDNVVKVDGNSITWNSKPKEPFFFSGINNHTKGKASWTLIHEQEKIGIQESSDFDIQKINVWGNGHVVSPEIYFQIEVVPGEMLEWSRKYKVFTLSEVQKEDF